MRLLPLVLVLLVASLTGAARADTPALTGEVGLGESFSITLKDASGAVVKHLDPGTYTLVVHDHSADHNFHLFGPGGVDVSTDIGRTGDSTFTVTLVDGTYRYVCDAHATSMKGAFTVGTVTTTTTTTAAKTTAPPKKKIPRCKKGQKSTKKHPCRKR
jgi:hypothetical protein